MLWQAAEPSGTGLYHVENSLILVSQKQARESNDRHGKIHIKSEKITPFGEIYYASKAFYALLLDKVIIKNRSKSTLLCIIPCWRSDDGEGKVSSSQAARISWSLKNPMNPRYRIRE